MNKALEAQGYYNKGEYQNAINGYKAAYNEKPDNYQVSYNLGNAYYKAAQYDTASMYFSIAKDISNENKAKHYYNLGNALFQSQKYEASRDAYIECLKLDPKDNDARHNLFMVQEMLRNKQMQQQHQQQLKQEQQQNQEEKKEKEEKEQEKDKQNSEEQKDQQEQSQQQQNQENNDQGNGEKDQDQSGDSEQQQKQQNQQDKQGQKGQGQEDQQKDKPRQDSGNANDQNAPQNQQGDQSSVAEPKQINPDQISKEDAEMIYKAIEAEEQETMEKLKNQRVMQSGSTGQKAEKQW
ncbi:MAG: tetratricopeptide repeat protein [Bacteroidales bacterium]|nr:tetratricopeptide repeat protein [Bacteroidales bacterium]